MDGMLAMNDLRLIRRRDCLHPLCLAAALSAAAPIACGGASGGVGDAKLPHGATSETLDHEDCGESGHRVEVLDTNNDGKPDIRRVYDKGSGHEVCRVVDLNHDGHPDLYEYFDSNGTLRRREFCYDDTGAVNAIEYYENGKLARREYDTSGQRRIDTWDWFDPAAPVDAKTGRPAHPSRRERDTTGDGRVDQWWTWDGDKVTIAVDRSGDGKPDPEATVVLGGSTDDAGAAAVPGTSSAAAADSGASAVGADAGSAAASTVAPPSASVVAAGDAGASPRDTTTGARDGGKR